jgi:hypothetical protein
MRLEPISLVLAHYRVYSLPHNGVLILGPGAPFPAHVDQRTSILAWSGHASGPLAAMEAAF